MMVENLKSWGFVSGTEVALMLQILFIFLCMVFTRIGISMLKSRFVNSKYVFFSVIPWHRAVKELTHCKRSQKTG